MLFKVPGNENPSILISFASKTFNAGQLTSKLHVIELGAVPGCSLYSGFFLHMYIIWLVLSLFGCFLCVWNKAFLCEIWSMFLVLDIMLSVKGFGFWLFHLLLGKPSFTKKQADLFFPPDFADDFPVSMQVEHSLLFI